MKAGITKAGLSYILCKFHIFRSFNNKIKELGYSPTNCTNIMSIMKEIYACRSIIDANNLIDNKLIIFTEPYNYIKTYYNKVDTCISMNRYNNIGLYTTNNMSEIFFSYLQKIWNKNKVKRIDILVNKIILLLTDYQVKQNPNVSRNVIFKQLKIN